jgi:hypothetical protein
MFASDHSSFWKQGYSAILIVEAYYGGDFNPHYHTTNDRIKHFNLKYFYELSKLAIASISCLAFNNINPPNKLVNDQDLVHSNIFLEQNYPNPFNPSTTIKFKILKPQFTTLKVYNTLGKEVAILVSDKLNPGYHTCTFNGKKLASGVYYYQLLAGDYRKVKKMILLR